MIGRGVVWSMMITKTISSISSAIDLREDGGGMQLIDT